MSLTLLQTSDRVVVEKAALDELIRAAAYAADWARSLRNGRTWCLPERLDRAISAVNEQEEHADVV